MRYTAKLNAKEIEENYGHFEQRIALYKERGLDFLGSRSYILGQARPLNGPILEIGCGNGYASIALAEAGYSFTAIDPDRESLQKTACNLAKKELLNKVTLYEMDAEKMGFANKSFANIVMIGLLHHIYEADKIFLELDRVLTAEGKLILADFNQRGLQIIESVHREEGREHPRSDIGRDYARSFFHKLGYEIKDLRDDCHWALICRKKIEL